MFGPTCNICCCYNCIGMRRLLALGAGWRISRSCRRGYTTRSGVELPTLEDLYLKPGDNGNYLL